MSETKREFLRGEDARCAALSQYDRLLRIAMSHGLHIQRVEGYQVVNIRREVVLGTIPMTLDELDTTFSQTLAQLGEEARHAYAQALIDAKVEAGELERLPGGLVRETAKGN